MNKKLKVTLLTIIFAALFALSVKSCVAMLPKAKHMPSDYDNGYTYVMAQKDDKPAILVFYADWCTYCKKFMPKMDKVRNIHEDDFNVVLINVDDPNSRKFIEEYKISAYPSVYIFDPKYDNRVHIDNPYLDSVKTLNTEVERYGNFRKAIKGAACK